MAVGAHRVPEREVVATNADMQPRADCIRAAEPAGGTYIPLGSSRLRLFPDHLLCKKQRQRNHPYSFTRYSEPGARIFSINFGVQNNSIVIKSPAMKR